MLDGVTQYVTRDTDADPLTDPISTLGMARIVFGDDSSHRIRKTWLADITDTSILVPKAAREDTTGNSHLTNDIKQGHTYAVGLLLADPEGHRYDYRWQRRHTVQFRGYVNSRNHITIPQPVRDDYDLTDGDTVQIAVTERVFDPEHAQQSFVPDWRQL